MDDLELGTPMQEGATRLVLLGSGELGKEIAIEGMRLGLEIVAVDHYANAPAMQVAQRSFVMDMQDGEQLRRLIKKENPAFVVPEVEAIDTQALLQLQQEGFNVIPSAEATWLTMDREGIRRLASEKLRIKTSPYVFAGSEDECIAAMEQIGFPCIVKPLMSSSGKGQVLVHHREDAYDAWSRSVDGGRGSIRRVIVEEVIDFDYEITLLTVRHSGGTSYCAPVGHLQQSGDYIESWQPQEMSSLAFSRSMEIAKQITNELGGFGVFGVEFFVKGDEVFFSEVSPRPHDTGMVTMVSQNLSEFSLHIRAILGMKIGDIELLGPAASKAIVANGTGNEIRYKGLDEALNIDGVDLRIFGKPEISGRRRLAVALARADSVEEARKKVRLASSLLRIDIR